MGHVALSRESQFSSTPKKMAEEDPQVTESKAKLEDIIKGLIGDKKFQDVEAPETANTIQNAAMEYLQANFEGHKIFVNVFIFNVNGYAETRSTLWTKDDKDMSVLVINDAKVGVILKALANPM